jgi:hypothetical protein
MPLDGCRPPLHYEGSCKDCICTKIEFINLDIQNIVVMTAAITVPAVYDGLAARIRALRNKDQGRQTVAEFWRGNGA